MLASDEVEAVRQRLAGGRATGPKLTPEQREQLVRDWLSSPLTPLAVIARRYGITRQSAGYLVRRAAKGESAA